MRSPQLHDLALYYEDRLTNPASGLLRSCILRKSMTVGMVRAALRCAPIG